MTLAQFIAKKTGLGKRHAKAVLDRGEVFLNHSLVCDGSIALDKFDHLTVTGETLQSNTRRIILLHKPAGILSATSDPAHRTVIDLIREPWASELHLAGRLDRATTGLVILTNDSAFSESLTQPGNRIPKTYLVETDLPISAEAIDAFRNGMSFAKEKIRTQPAIVVPVLENSCRLTIHEGKHHQIKRMFLRFGIRVTSLHRESIGPYVLPNDLAPGEYRTFAPSGSIHPPPKTLAEDDLPYVIDPSTGMAVSRSLNTPGFVPPTAEESQAMIDRANEEEDFSRAELLR